jgi:competence protein ComEA
MVDPSTPPWRTLEDAPEPTGPSRSVAVDPARPVIPVGSTMLLIVAAGILAIGAFFLAFGTSSGGTVVMDGGVPLSSAELGDGPATSIVPSVAGQLVVEIVGAVDRPGVFRLPDGARVGDLVAAAGGYGARVDADRASHELNLAAPLHDGDHVRVPSRDDPPVQRPATAGGSDEGPSGSASKDDGPLELNSATTAELEALPGIGPVTAAKIVSAREEQAFTSVEDLRTRKLVGEKTFEKIRDLVAVR